MFLDFLAFEKKYDVKKIRLRVREEGKAGKGRERDIQNIIVRRRYQDYK